MRDKQIEEMAKIINKPCFEIMDEAGATDRDCPFPYGCEECAATNLYNAGYRKASEVIEDVFLVLDKRTEDEGLVFVKKSTLKSTLIEWREKKKVEIAREIFEEIEKALDNSVETEHFKGTWFNFSKFKQMLAELKKKHLGEDINAPTKESEGDK